MSPPGQTNMSEQLVTSFIGSYVTLVSFPCSQSAGRIQSQSDGDQDRETEFESNPDPSNT